MRNEYRCNLIIPGFAKSGTSSLHSYLAQHPRIIMSRIKEPHYFAIEKEWERGANFHNELFNVYGNKKVAYYGESSTTYSCSAKAMKRIQEQLDKPKIIFLVRDPVQRVVSHYRWMCSLGLEKRPFLEAIQADGFNFDPDRSTEGNYKSYLQFSSYSEVVPQWQVMFGEANVLVLFTDELAKDANGVLERCWEFLELPSAGKIAEIRSNQTGIRVQQRTLAKLIIKTVPNLLREHIKKSSLLSGLWNRTSHYQLVVYSPEISSGDKVRIAEILVNEVKYYKTLRSKYSLFDSKFPC